MSKQRYGRRPVLSWRHAAVFLATFLLLPACTSEEVLVPQSQAARPARTAQ